MVRSFRLFGFVSLCIAAASFIGSAVVGAIERVVRFVASAFAAEPRFAFDGPAAPRIVGSPWSFPPLVERHEAGVSRRSAQRNI